MDQEQKQTTEGRRFISKTLGLILDDIPVLKKFYLNEIDDLSYELSCTAKVVTLQPGENLPMHKKGMYLLAEGFLETSRDPDSYEQ